MLWNDIIALALADNAPNPRRTLVTLAYKSDDEYISRLESAIEAAAESAGYDVRELDAQNYADLQLAQVAAARNSGEKGILINLVDPDTAPAILKAAGDMKVVLVNRAPTDMSILNKNAVYVGSDEKVAGRLQGEWLAKHFTDRGIREIRYLLLKGPPNLPSTIQRTGSVLQALSDGGIRATEAAAPIVANYDRNEARYKLSPLLSSDVKFDAIISNNDAMALGAIQAMEALNIDPMKTTIVGIDATQPAVQALLAGKLAMTVFQDAVAQGSVSVTALTNMIDGNPLDTGTGYPVSAENPYVIWIPFEPVTRSQIPRNLRF